MCERNVPKQVAICFLFTDEKRKGKKKGVLFVEKHLLEIYSHIFDRKLFSVRHDNLYYLKQKNRLLQIKFIFKFTSTIYQSFSLLAWFLLKLLSIGEPENLLSNTLNTHKQI